MSDKTDMGGAPDRARQINDSEWYYDDNGLGTAWAKDPFGDGQDFRVFDVRGWGHLTGKGGGLGMDNEPAREVQDSVAKRIVELHNINLAGRMAAARDTKRTGGNS